MMINGALKRWEILQALRLTTEICNETSEIILERLTQMQDDTLLESCLQPDT